MKIKVFYSYEQKYETTQEKKPNCSNFQILLDFIAMNGVIFHTIISH